MSDVGVVADLVVSTVGLPVNHGDRPGDRCHDTYQNRADRRGNCHPSHARLHAQCPESGLPRQRAPRPSEAQDTACAPRRQSRAKGSRQLPAGCQCPDRRACEPAPWALSWPTDSLRLRKARAQTRVRETGSGSAGRGAAMIKDRVAAIGAALALLVLLVLVALDMSMPPDFASLTALFGLAPLIACAVVPPRETAAIGILTVGVALASGAWNDAFGTAQHNVRVINVLLVSAAAVAISVRARLPRAPLRAGVGHRGGGATSNSPCAPVQGRSRGCRVALSIGGAGGTGGRRPVRLLPLRHPHPLHRRRRPREGDHGRGASRARHPCLPAVRGPAAPRWSGSPKRWTTTSADSSATRSS